MEQVMSSRINLARSYRKVTPKNVQDGEVLSMRDAVSRTCSLYWKKFGIRPTTLSISIGWWTELHQYFVTELGLSYNEKYTPMTFGYPFSTEFNVGCMEAGIDPIQLGINMPKNNDELPDIDVEAALAELEEEMSDDDAFDIALELSNLMDGEDANDAVDVDVDYVIEFSAYHEVEQKWIEYEFATHKNGSLILDDDPSILYAFVYGKINKKGRMKKPRLAIVWVDQPSRVYTWPIYVDTLYNVVVGDSLATYVAQNLAIGEDMEHEFFSFEEFKQMMADRFNIRV